MKLYGRGRLLERGTQDIIELLGRNAFAHATNEPHGKAGVPRPRNDIPLVNRGIVRFEP